MYCTLIAHRTRKQPILGLCLRIQNPVRESAGSIPAGGTTTIKKSS